MIHLERSPAPEFWTWERVREWTRRWKDRGHRSGDWHWPAYDGQTINNQAREAMWPWHHGKCAFCEAPLIGNTEIEHFRSKTEHPWTAFAWYNLFLICPNCNSAKGGDSYIGCLKPDRDDPADCLWINPVSRRVEPRPGISEQDFERARITIKRYGLDRPELRRLYERYFFDNVAPHLVPVAALACQDQESQTEGDICSCRIAVLRALTQPEQSFSLMVKSVLEYYGFNIDD